MWIASTISSFIAGLLTGICTIIALAVYYLSKDDNDESKTASDERKRLQANELKEGEPTEYDMSLVSDALKFLRGDDLVTNDDTFPSEEKVIAKEQMDKAFAEYSKDAKERQKQVKCLHLFFGDYNKLSKNYSKDLGKLSQVAESYVKAENDKYLDKWWNALSIAMDHISQDQDYLSDVIEHDICYNLHRVYEEHSHLEKQLNSEGSKHLSKMKDAMTAFDIRSKDRDKIREKVNACLGRVTHLSTIPSSLSSETTKLSHKLGISEGLLQDAISRLASAQQEFNEKMPRILADYKLMTANSTSTMRELLIKLADIVTTTHTKSNQVMHRLKMDLASSTMLKQEEDHSYDPSLKEVLETIAEGKTSQLNMNDESAAGLAASLPSRVPAMPTQFGQAVGKETCVWLNAFSGRMYRDTARSDYFHNWFYEKVAKMLNKDRRPGYIDEFKVGNVSFGSIPPLLCNMQWAPVCVGDGTDPEYDVACIADMTFRSGLQFTVSTRLWLNWPMDKFAFIPVVIQLEISELCGKIRFGVRKRRSFLSFVGEPYSRFTVHSEVGSQYKVKNIPKLSSLIIKKIKTHIRKKLIYPNSYEFRLVWPKNWWPGGPDGDLPTAAEALHMKSTVPTSSSISTSEGLVDNSVASPLDGTETCSSVEEVERDLLAVGNGIRSTVREGLSRWFRPRVAGPTSLGTRSNENGQTDNVNDVSDKWLNAFAATLKIVGTAHELGELEGEFCDIDDTRSCVSSSELIRKPRDALKLKEIFAPIHSANFTPELQLSARVAWSRPRAHSISDFRSLSISKLMVKLFIDRDALRARGKQQFNQSVFELTSVSNSRIADEAEPGKRTQVGWLQKLRKENRHKIASRLQDLTSKVTQKIAVNGPSIKSDAVAVAGAVFGALSSVPNHTKDRTSSLGGFSRRHLESNTPSDLAATATAAATTSDSRDSTSAAPTTTSTSVSQAPSARSGLFRFGRKILEAKDSLKKEISKTVERRKKNRFMACVSYEPEENEMEDNGEEESFGSPDKHLDRSSRGSNMSDSGSVSSASTTQSSPTVSRRESSSSITNVNAKLPDLEREAMTLAWQARAQAITLAAEDGQQPSMQGFLRTPLRTSPKMWVVLRAGSLAVFNDPADCQGGVPRTIYSLSESVCRPSDQPNSFELGMSDGSRGRYWLTFWTESDVQCKAWVMAVQHSANIL